MARYIVCPLCATLMAYELMEDHQRWHAEGCPDPPRPPLAETTPVEEEPPRG